MAKAHERVLKITAEISGGSNDQIEVTALEYFRDRSHFNEDEGFALEFTAGSAADDHEIELGQLLPPPTHIAFDISNPA